MIRPATSQDAQAILDIYSHYVYNSHSTFELIPPSLTYMEDKIRNAQHPWLVYEEQGQVIGYAYAIHWKMREAYKRTCETSVYLHHEAGGKGIGAKLYQALMDILKEQGYHAIIGGISLPNDASVRLHEKLGFKKIAEFKEVGYKFDRWIDVGYWELIQK